MKALALALSILASQFAFAQTTPSASLLERARKALENHVSTDIAVTFDGEEINIARSDIRLEWQAGGKFKVWVRVNILPYMPGAREKIVAKLNENETIIGAVSDFIHQSVRNQLAVKLGIPAEFVVVPAPLLQAALAANLKTAVATFVDGKITSEAQATAALRELGVAFSVVGDAQSKTQLVFEGGKIEPMLARDNGYFMNHFAVSSWGFRASFRRDISENWSLKAYVSATDDPGLWEVADPTSNPNAAYIAALIAGESAKLFDLNKIDAYEAGIINTINGQTWAIAVGTRPVLNRGVESRYVLTRWDATVLSMKVEAEGSLESFDDPVFGETLVKRFSGGVQKEFKGYTVGAKAYSRYDSFLRKDFANIQLSLTKALWRGLGIGARVYTYKYHGVDDNGNDYQRQYGWDAGVAWKFGESRPNPAQVLAERDRKLNEERLKAQKKENK